MFDGNLSLRASIWGGDTVHAASNKHAGPGRGSGPSEPSPDPLFTCAHTQASYAHTLPHRTPAPALRDCSPASPLLAGRSCSSTSSSSPASLVQPC